MNWIRNYFIKRMLEPSTRRAIIRAILVLVGITLTGDQVGAISGLIGAGIVCFDVFTPDHVRDKIFTKGGEVT